MHWKHWNWLDNGILPLALIVMRVGPLWLWVTIAQQTLTRPEQSNIFPLGLMAALLWLSWAITRLGLLWGKRLAQLRLVVAGLGLGLMLVLLWGLLYRADYALWDKGWLIAWQREMFGWVGHVPLAYLLLLSYFYLWLRGIIDGSRHLEHRHVIHAFRTGSLSLVGLLLIATPGNQPLPAATGGVIFLFFATATLALALSSLKIARLNVMAQVQLRFSLNRYWGGSALLVIVSLLGLGLLLSALVDPESIHWLVSWSWSWFGQILLWLIKITSLLLYPILYVLSLVLPPLLALLFAPFTDRAPVEFDSLAGPGRLNGLFSRWGEALTHLPVGVQGVGLLLLLLGLALIFALVLQKLVAEAADDGIEERREFIFSYHLLLAQLAQWWPVRWRRAGRDAAAPFPFLGLSAEVDSRRAIRAMYQRLLKAAQAQGRPRLAPQTPVEYAQELSRTWPESRAGLTVLTRHYGQARYGSAGPSPEQLQASQQAWEKLSRIIGGE
jgi:hypothetical protein